ncbi:hypothetical protein OE88DRAFT_1659497 [Heliocybe sulcata]|uniref:DUF6533 domain-containing protein n=1 Tax=Heliocybe sulcata TaxID=5364 RepID=A0A5C3N2M5_9AGAM|nr:hypothetical protein OE88DRAFT_1659497 [Heliocybe sulcata]
MSAVALTASTGSSLRDVVPFSIVATGTILIYDLLCTLDDEVEYVWKARQNLGTNLYYLNRYTPFIDTFISLDLLTGRHSPQACERNFKVVLWLIVLGTLISECPSSIVHHTFPISLMHVPSWQQFCASALMPYGSVASP